MTDKHQLGVLVPALLRWRPRRADDMYQSPAARLRLIEDVGMYKPTLLRTKEPGTVEVLAFLS